MKKRIILSIAVLMFMQLNLFSQLQFDWAKKTSLNSIPGRSHILSSQTDINGDIICYIEKEGVVDFDVNSNENKGGTQDFPSLNLIKYNPINGDTIFIKSLFLDFANLINYTSSDNTLMMLDNSGNIYIKGKINGTPGIDMDPSSGTSIIDNCIFVAKYDNNGNYLWVKTWSLASNLDFKRSAINSSGEMIIIGSYAGTVDFDPSPAVVNLSSSTLESFILKIDANGSYLNAIAIPNLTGNYAYLQDLEFNSLDQLILYGRFYGTKDLNFGSGTNNYTSNFSTSYDAFIGVYDNNFNLLNLAQLRNVSGSPRGYSDADFRLAVGSDNSIYVDVRFADWDIDPSAGVTYPSNSHNICKYNSSLAFQWFYSSSANQVDDIVIDNSNNCYFSNRQNIGGFYFSKLNSAGSSLFNMYIINTNGKARTIEINGSGNILLGGDYYNYGTLDFDPSSGTITLPTTYINSYISDSTQCGFYGIYDSNSGSGIIAKGLNTYKGRSFISNHYFLNSVSSIVRPSANEVYIAGRCYYSGDFSNQNNKIAWMDRGLYIAKCDTSGSILWFKNYPMSKDFSGVTVDAFINIDIDNNNNCFAFGSYPGTIYGFTNGQTSSDHTGFLLKLDPSGNQVFVKYFNNTFNNSSQQYMTVGGIKINSFNHVIIAGSGYGSYNLNPSGSDIVGGTSMDQAFFARYDNNGNWQYSKKYNYTTWQRITDLQLDNSDNIYVAGVSQENLDFDLSASTVQLSTGSSQIGFYAKYDQFGNYQMAKSFLSGGINSSLNYNVKLDLDGSNNVFLGGSFYGTITLHLDGGQTYTPSNSDMYFMKYNSVGTLQWFNTLGSASSEYIRDIAVDNDGNINITGEFDSFMDFDPGIGNEYLSTANGYTDIFLARYNSNGEHIYSLDLGTSGHGRTYSLLVSNDGILHLGTNGYGDFDPGSNMEEGHLIQYQQSRLSATTTINNHVLCYGANTGSATVVPDGTHPPFTYLWSPSGQTTATAINLGAGTHTVTVTDALGTTVTNTIVINQPSAPLNATITSQTDVNCNGGSNGSANVTVTGGTPNYSYSWSPSGGTAALATGLAANNYTVTVTDANSCTTSASVTINQPAVLSLSIASQINVSCFGGSTGAATVVGSGGSGSFNYSWQPISTTGATASNLTAGTYTAQVTDLNGCIAQIPVVITQPSQLIASASSITNVTCVSTTDGAATITVTGGTPNYSYSWNPTGGTSATATNLAVGNYTCTVTDANFCSVNVPVQIQNLLPTQEVCVVTVDTVLADHNIVVWEKATNIGNVDSFYIYREITTNVYSKIGAVHRDSLSEFHDYGANPNSTSYKYRITVLDTCGSEGDYGLYHKSIHLQYSGLGNFLWTFYDIESLSNQVASYNFWRDDLGTGVWSILQTVSGSTSSFTDVNYASFPNARYRVDLNWISGVVCTPSRVGVNTSRSNIKNQTSTPTEINEILSESVGVYPNPTEGLLSIRNVYGINIESIRVMDASGKLCNVSATKNTIDISNLERGIYFIQLNTSLGSTTIKVTRM